MKQILGFLTTDGEVLATVGVDYLQRKKIRPTKHDSKNAAQTLYVTECLTHVNSPFLRISLFEFKSPELYGPDKWIKVAEAFACPLCWKLEKVFEDEGDWKLPDVIPEVDPNSVRDLEFKKGA